jgi:hypothetical protein
MKIAANQNGVKSLESYIDNLSRTAARELTRYQLYEHYGKRYQSFCDALKKAKRQLFWERVRQSFLRLMGAA